MPGVDAGTSNHVNTVGRSTSTSTEDDLSGSGSSRIGRSFKNKRSVSYGDDDTDKPVQGTGRRNTFLQRASTNYGGSFDPKAVENVYQVCRMLPQFVALVLAMAACELEFHQPFPRVMRPPADRVSLCHAYRPTRAIAVRLHGAADEWISPAPAKHVSVARRRSLLHDLHVCDCELRCGKMRRAGL